jgi:hypothetical protein
MKSNADGALYSTTCKLHTPRVYWVIIDTKESDIVFRTVSQDKTVAINKMVAPSGHTWKQLYDRGYRAKRISITVLD